MKQTPDLYLAHLMARDLSGDILLAYAEDMYRANGPSSIRTSEIERQFRELADRLGFEVVKRTATTVAEAAE